MARPKKVALVATETKPKEKKIVLTREQFESLKTAAEKVGEARRIINKIDEAETVAAVSFAAGRAFAEINLAEDLLDEIVNEVGPDEDDNIWGDLDI